MKKVSFLFLMLFASHCLSFSQIIISTDSNTPDNTAMLDIESVEKGVLIPQLTLTQIEAITLPANGLVVFCTTDDKFYAFRSTYNEWKEIDYGTGSINTNCGSVTDVDGHTYNTILIGTQCWMKENLATTKYYDGTDIPWVTGSYNWVNLSTPAYTYYNNYGYYGSTVYGALYNWFAVETGILCPTGWHVPSDEEWKTLEMHLGMSQSEADNLLWRGTNEGSKMKSSYIYWENNGYGTNSSGLSIVAGGFRWPDDGYFYRISERGYFWSSTEYTSTEAWYRNLSNLSDQVFRANPLKVYGMSVRCLMD